jgi:hypothetical protein
VSAPRLFNHFARRRWPGRSQVEVRSTPRGSREPHPKRDIAGARGSRWVGCVRREATCRSSAPLWPSRGSSAFTKSLSGCCGGRQYAVVHPPTRPHGGAKVIRMHGRSTGRNFVRVTMASVPGTAGSGWSPSLRVRRALPAGGWRVLWSSRTKDASVDRPRLMGGYGNGHQRACLLDG